MFQVFFEELRLVRSAAHIPQAHRSQAVQLLEVCHNIIEACNDPEQAKGALEVVKIVGSAFEEVKNGKIPAGGTVVNEEKMQQIKTHAEKYQVDLGNVQEKTGTKRGTSKKVTSIESWKEKKKRKVEHPGEKIQVDIYIGKSGLSAASECKPCSSIKFKSKMSLDMVLLALIERKSIDLINDPNPQFYLNDIFPREGSTYRHFREESLPFPEELQKFGRHQLALNVITDRSSHIFASCLTKPRAFGNLWKSGMIFVLKELNGTLADASLYFKHFDTQTQFSLRVSGYTLPLVNHATLDVVLKKALKKSDNTLLIDAAVIEDAPKSTPPIQPLHKSPQATLPPSSPIPPSLPNGASSSDTLVEPPTSPSGIRAPLSVTLEPDESSVHSESPSLHSPLLSQKSNSPTIESRRRPAAPVNSPPRSVQSPSQTVPSPRSPGFLSRAKKWLWS